MGVLVHERQLGEDPDRLDFASRELFLDQFSSFVDTLYLADSVVSGVALEQRGRFVELTRRHLEGLREEFSSQELGLFEKAFNLFCIKNNLPPFDTIPEANRFVEKDGLQELSVEIAGPLAVGKTTLAGFLAKEIGAKEEREGYEAAENPFLELSYENPDFMLRTQTQFLLDNIIDGLRGKYYEGRWVRDTSVWSDIFVFMEWRRKAGIVTEAEHTEYMKLVRILSPLIQKPDLLIMLKPVSAERLKEGLDLRIEGDPEVRGMEKTVTVEDLKAVVEASESAAHVLRDDVGLNVLELTVDPVEFYRKPELKYATVYAIREKLNILKEYLIKDPQEAAKEVVGVFAPSKPPQVVLLHSESMFAGKTTTLNRVAEIIGQQNILGFQPAKALRYGEEHKDNIIDRDKRMLPANTIDSNKLTDILSHLDELGITPYEKPVIFIDEIMLFVESDAQEAIEVVSTLRLRGFQVVATGIDRTFQEEPFTFMYDLLNKTLSDEGWHEIRLGTKCKYCDNEAVGSRRIKPNGSIADYKDQTFEAGDNYEPVCCKNGHISCTNQPEAFQRRPLPTKIKNV